MKVASVWIFTKFLTPSFYTSNLFGTARIELTCFSSMYCDSCKALEPPTVQTWQQLPNFQNSKYKTHIMLSFGTTEFPSLFKT